MSMSLFQPDAASDWWNFAVSLLAAIGTIAAVLFAVLNSRQADTRAKVAQADAKVAQADAKDAQARASAADERAIEAAERQAEASERISATELQLENERRAYAKQADLERKAQRQAVEVSVATHWHETSDPARDAVDDYSRVSVWVGNHSLFPIRDVAVRIEGSYYREEAQYDFAALIEKNRGVGLLDGPRYLPGVLWGSQLSVTLAFTDSYGDRWQRAPDGGLLLLTPRSIKEAPQGFEGAL
jgi:hypothetical protein